MHMSVTPLFLVMTYILLYVNANGVRRVVSIMYIMSITYMAGIW